MFKEMTKWIDDTVTYVLSRKHQRDVDPEQEVGPVVDGIIERCIGNRSAFGSETVDMIIDSAVSWAYAELRESLPSLSTQEFYKNPDGPFPKRACVLEIGLKQGPKGTEIHLRSDKAGDQWPLDDNQEPLTPDDATIVVDARKVDRIIIIE